MARPASHSARPEGDLVGVDADLVDHGLRAMSHVLFGHRHPRTLANAARAGTTPIPPGTGNPVGVRAAWPSLPRIVDVDTLQL